MSRARMYSRPRAGLVHEASQRRRERSLRSRPRSYSGGPYQDHRCGAEGARRLIEPSPRAPEDQFGLLAEFRV